MAGSTYDPEVIIKFSDDFKNLLCSHIDEVAQKINESKSLSESQVMYLNSLKNSESKASYLLHTCMLPKLQAGHTNLFEVFLEYMMILTFNF